jgi:hypothetical protein
MKRSLQLIAFLSFALVASNAFSQAVAYVYVANNPQNSSTNEITAFAAEANGKLKPIFGSPFRENVDAMAVDGGHLLAVNHSQPNIDTFVIESDGALRYQASSNYAKYSPREDCPSANRIFFDHTGATLYVQEFNADCANTGVASFWLNKTSGNLRYLGVDITGAFPGDNNAASFTGNNRYAYTAVNSDCMYYTIYGFKRGSNGLLTSAGSVANLPTPPPNFRRFIPDLVAADPYNNLAVLMQPANPPGCSSEPLQIATYTANSSGVLRTKSTYADMPSTLIASPYDMNISPSGKLLAVAGQEGLQVLFFNEGYPAARYTGLLTKAPINQIFWDNSNHLYGISQATNKLYVFTVTPTYTSNAPGSPYPIGDPQHLIVQPLVHR